MAGTGRKVGLKLLSEYKPRKKKYIKKIKEMLGILKKRVHGNFLNIQDLQDWLR